MKVTAHGPLPMPQGRFEMLSRLNVRNKLLVILLPLLVAVAALAGIGVLDRLDTRDQAQANQDLVSTARAGADVVFRLQIERLDAVGRRAGIGATVADPQSATNSAISAYRSRLDSLASSTSTIQGQSSETLTQGVINRLDQLGDTRSSLETGSATPAGINETYSSLIDGIIAADAQLLAQGGTEQAGGSASRWLIESTEADARAGSTAIAVAAATRDGKVGDATALIDQLPELRRESASWLDVFLSDGGTVGRTAYDSVLSDPAFAGTQATFNSLNNVVVATGITGDPAVWLRSTSDRIQALWSAQQQLIDNEINVAAARVDSLERQIRLYVGGSAVALILGLLLAATVTRVITGSLSKLTTGARIISQESLPRLIESLKHPEIEAGLQPTAIAVTGSDEFAELAAAFQAVENTALDVAAEQSATLRKGIGEIFVNLARRNQSLLDRQIEFIDRLEANEEDPDQLENLFKLDHLATRMRRNAESLLVLAGAEAPRRRGREVTMTDVIRVAVGEVEDFTRVTLLAVDHALASGVAAVDVAHLLSELMENGTQYSPPEQRVEVVGHRTKDGGYVVSISDHGVGMSPEARSAANDLLAHPPLVGLSLSRSLGFIVAATLAARHRISIRLTESPSGGITALVTLPAELLVGERPADAMAPTEAMSIDGLPANALASPGSTAFRDEGPSPVPIQQSMIGSSPSGHDTDDWMSDLPPFPVYEEPVPEPAPQLNASFEVEPTGPEASPWQSDAPPRTGSAMVEFGLSENPLDDVRDPAPSSAPTWEHSARNVTDLPTTSPVEQIPEPVAPPQPAVVNEPVAPLEVTASSENFASSNGHANQMGAAFEAGLFALLDQPSTPASDPSAVVEPAPMIEPTPIYEPAPIYGPAPIYEPAPRYEPAPTAAAPVIPRAPAPIAHPLPTPIAPIPAISPIIANPATTPSLHRDLGTPIAQPMAPLVPSTAGPRPIAATPTGPIAGIESLTAPIAHGSAPPTAPLPQRRAGATSPAPLMEIDQRIGAPTRPAEEIRSILSRYRSGLESGRDDQSNPADRDSATND